jgi:hypothetical protein
MRHQALRRWRSVFASLLTVVAIAAFTGVVSYQRFYHHKTSQEVSHAVEHTTFQVTMRSSTSVTLQLYQQGNAKGQPLVLFSSGDGGGAFLRGHRGAHRRHRKDCGGL